MRPIYSHQSSFRRGVILLLVLGLMTMFALLVLTFMVVTSQSYRMAQSASRAGAIVDHTDQTVGARDSFDALTELLVGSANSSIGNHSLLENLYGHPVVNGNDLLEFEVVTASYINDPSTGLTNQLIVLTLDTILDQNLYNAGVTTEGLLDLMGNVLTFITGAHEEVAARIVHKRILRAPSPMDPWQDQILVFIKPLKKVIDPAIVPGSICLVNGAPFSGTGIGYDPTAAPWQAALSEVDHDGLPLVLRPNAKAPDSNGNYYEEFLDTTFVQMNVDYTAPDVNNMFLAWYDLRLNGTDWDFARIIPSFLRPSLMEYLLASPAWNNASTTDEQRKDMLRKMVLRPLPFDHQDFDGGNLHWSFPSGTNWNKANLERLAALCGGTSFFDVDVDGDGVKEGIWIDAGLPVRMSSSGKMYKPLVSYTVLDMDGRTNVNTHGNRGQVFWTTGLDGKAYYGINSNAIAPDGTPMTTPMIRGAGYGPGGVRLAYTFEAILDIARTMYGMPVDERGERAAWYLMTGYGAHTGATDPNDRMPGRYGYDNSARPGLDRQVDVDAGGDFYDRWVRLYELFFPRSALLHNIGGVAPDFWDVSPVAFDAFGQRIPSFPVGNDIWAEAVLHNPYRFNPYHDMTRDSQKLLTDEVPDMRFTLSELEGLLRQTDVDQASLPSRLRRILLDDPSDPSAGGNLADKGRYFLTTESHDIPLPNPRFGRHSGIYTLLYHCVEDQYIRLGYPSQLPLSMATSRTELRTLLAPTVTPLVDKLVDMLPEQIRNGEKLDLNVLAQKLSWVDPALHLDGLQERADLARGIYILLMAMSYEQLYGVDSLYTDGVGNWYLSSVNGIPTVPEYAFANPYFEPSLAQEERLDWPNKSGTAQDKAKELARQVMATRLAQYAVNLIDYADADATMTPMIFDVDPFAVVFADHSLSCWLPANGEPAGFRALIAPYYNNAGWTNTDLMNYLSTAMPGSDVRTTNMCRIRLIRGMERSDVVLTETMATHDLGVADTALDSTNRTPTTSPTTPTTTDHANKDPNFDQIRMPEASAWFELFCTTDGNQTIQPQDLYDNVGGVWYLDLERRAALPTLDGGTSRYYPVWHLAISESTNPLPPGSDKNKREPNNPENSISIQLAGRDQRPVTFSLQTQQPEVGGFTNPSNFYGSVLGPTDNTSTNDVAIDRIAWFWQAHLDVPNLNIYPNWEQIYWNRGSGNPATANTGGFAQTQLRPADYFVVAPRMTTNLGSLSSTLATGGKYGVPSGESIDLQFPTTGPGNNPLFVGVRPPKVIVAAASSLTQLSAKSNWNTTEWDTDELPQSPIINLGVGTGDWQLGIGINISAPNPNSNFYPLPPKSFGDNSNLCGDGALEARYPDHPYDLDHRKNQENGASVPSNSSGLGNNEHFPLVKDELYGVGTVPMYRSVMLQRLADPNLPYDPIFNPYVTVDWSMIDLTVFSGEDGDVDPSYQFNTTGAGASIAFNDKDNDSGINASDMPNIASPKKDGDYRVRLSSRQASRTAMPGDLWGRNDPSGKRYYPNLWARVLDPKWVVDGDDTVLDSRQLDPSLLIAKNLFLPLTGDAATEDYLDDIIKNMNFPHRPQHTFGRLNWMYNADGPSAIDTSFAEPPYNHIARNVSRGYSATDNLGRIVLSDPVGAPILVQTVTDTPVYCPFINLSWNNSPYSNPYEVMSVPASAPGRFGLEFVDRNWEDYYLYNQQSNPTNPNNFALLNCLPSTPPVTMPPWPAVRVGSLGSGGRFGFPLVDPVLTPPLSGSQYRCEHSGQGHLLNFFHSSPNVAHNGTTYEPRNLSMNLGEFLDHIQVPSRFFGTKEWLDLITPYSVPTYREPGRINVNTMTGPTFMALMNDRALPLDPDFNGGYHAFHFSRLVGSPNPLKMDLPPYFNYNSNDDVTMSVFPLDFTFPFRSQASHRFVPPYDFNDPPLQALTTDATLTGDGLVSNPADATLLRRYHGNEFNVALTSPPYPHRPLLTPPIGTAVGTSVPPPRTVTEDLEGLQRLSNMTTTRSNVFAVWVTVGYFEAEEVDFTNPTTADKLRLIYPDGYRYGKELGYGAGNEQVSRHRSFYLIDRTIPVGFRRGDKKLNVEDVILLKKSIE